MVSQEEEIRVRGKEGERRKNERTKQAEKRLSYKLFIGRKACRIRFLFFLIIYLDSCNTVYTQSLLSSVLYLFFFFLRRCFQVVNCFYNPPPPLLSSTFLVIGEIVSNTSLNTPKKCTIFIHYIYLPCFSYMFRCSLYHHQG